jgi:hypothetical protein
MPPEEAAQKWAHPTTNYMIRPRLQAELEYFRRFKERPPDHCLHIFKTIIFCSVVSRMVQGMPPMPLPDRRRPANGIQSVRHAP